jgi:alpha-mannosidase
MIKYINEHNTANIHLQFSTPSDYVAAVKAEKVAWPVRYEDAMPYGEYTNDFWTGYFSSRPAAKKEIRDFSALTNAEQKLFS